MVVRVVETFGVVVFVVVVLLGALTVLGLTQKVHEAWMRWRQRVR
jgi:hypothetical protein